jgi:hypothetical protein
MDTPIDCRDESSQDGAPAAQALPQLSRTAATQSLTFVFGFIMNYSFFGGGGIDSGNNTRCNPNKKATNAGACGDALAFVAAI